MAKKAKKTAKKKVKKKAKSTTKKATKKKVAKKKTVRKSAKNAKRSKKAGKKKKAAKKVGTKKKAAKKKSAKKVTKKASKKKATKKKSASKKAAKKVAKKKTAKKTGKKVTKKATKKAAIAKPTQTKKATVTSDLKIYESQVSLGKVVPDFSAPMTGDQTFELSSFKGKTVVIYFYPKDSTPGCTVEGHDFTALHSEFKAQGAEVFGLSRDSLKSHENFKSKQNYSFDLISDPDEAVCAIFGAIKLKNMYGKQVRGVDRSTFVIGPDGELKGEWRGVKVPEHAKEVLEFVKSASK